MSPYMFIYLPISIHTSIVFRKQWRSIDYLLEPLTCEGPMS